MPKKRKKGKQPRWRRAKDGFPLILEDAFNDPKTCQFDPVVKVALSDDFQEYTWALTILRSMYEFGREEAGALPSIIGKYDGGNSIEKN